MKKVIVAMIVIWVIMSSICHADYETFALGTMRADGLIEVGSEIFYVEISQEHLYLRGEILILSIVYTWDENLRCSQITGMTIIGVMP